jgi:hypothetical protein
MGHGNIEEHSHREDGFPIINVGNDGVGGIQVHGHRNDDVEDAIKTEVDVLTKNEDLKS